MHGQRLMELLSGFYVMEVVVGLLIREFRYFVSVLLQDFHGRRENGGEEGVACLYSLAINEV